MQGVLGGKYLWYVCLKMLEFLRHIFALNTFIYIVAHLIIYLVIYWDRFTFYVSFYSEIM